MESFYQVNIYNSNELHFGKESNYEYLNGSYFEQLESMKEDIIEKAIIKNIYYLPDDIYINSDGNAGRCWRAIIIDNGIKNYYFRNFSHLIHLYEKKGYQFVNSN